MLTLASWSQSRRGRLLERDIFGQIMGIHPVAEGALLLSLVLAMAAGLFWLMKRLRDVEADDGPDTSAMLTKFGELYSRGGLSDEEYRTIKTKLASQLQSDMGVSGAKPLADSGQEVPTTNQGRVEEAAGDAGAGDSGQGAL